MLTELCQIILKVTTFWIAMFSAINRMITSFIMRLDAELRRSTL